MNRSDMDAAVETLTRAQRGILLVVPEKPSTDAFAAMLGLSLALDRIGKQTTLVSPSFVPPHLQFLPGTSQVRDRIEMPADAVIEVPLQGARPRDVRWETIGDALRITVRANRRLAVAAGDVRVESGAAPWDAVVTLGAPRLDALGSQAVEHEAFFAETPLLNIDVGTTNTFFGTANLISTTAGTISEVILALLEALGDAALAPEVATCLFAGIASATDSFRTPTLTPRTLQAASRLLRQGADHQTVVRHLFRTHALAELRLLGRALSRLEELPRGSALTIVTERDLADAGTTADVMPSILKEILEWSGRARTTFLAFSRAPETVEVLVALGATRAEDRERFRASLGGVSVGPFVLVNLGFVTPENLPQTIRTQLVARLPEPEETSLVRAAAAERVSGTAGGASASPPR